MRNDLILRVPTIHHLITEASARCLTYIPPAGQRLTVDLLVICHVKESRNVPGPFQTEVNEITMAWENDGRWADGESRKIREWLFLNRTTFVVSAPCPLQVYVFLFLTGARWVTPLGRASSLVICLVNSVINHLLTMIELLLIAILHPPRCRVLDLANGDSLAATLSKGFGKKCTLKDSW